MQDFFAILGGSTLIIGFISWLLRRTIERAISEYIASKTKRSTYVFEQIHVRKMESISKLYEASVLASDATAYVVGMQGELEHERLLNLELEVKKFAEQYKLSRLWLSNDICNLVDQLLDQHSAFYQVVRGYQLKQSGLGKTLDDKMLSLWIRADEELPVLQEQLRKAFKTEMAKISP
ncbi:hypothetical protein [Vibrio alginolyticus]|uniref:hypothetical protein n=1 Tax=Vibrio alginolyticus TaxID=663 RepID=UPI002022FE71|nr:hypothetical protein [Vibrio alginolyticus]